MSTIITLLSFYRFIHSESEQGKVSFYGIVGPDLGQCFRYIAGSPDAFATLGQSQIGRDAVHMRVEGNNQIFRTELLPDTEVYTGIAADHPAQKHAHLLGFGRACCMRHSVDGTQHGLQATQWGEVFERVVKAVFQCFVTGIDFVQYPAKQEEIIVRIIAVKATFLSGKYFPVPFHDIFIGGMGENFTINPLGAFQDSFAVAGSYP